ncbi:hypothetical protein DN051_39495 [Streptomyces cadmiisoli]|uniref:Uncharacterized protein n=1 Tax=Streptomyces cadmiisoli TaxID=2184053 RepID=A0A2Z4JB63_9ACTN|nr:hypothetical protein DN051_39495 [Streptomyces cadmiisoli]
MNTLTGDFGLSATDASGFGLTARRYFSSRRPEMASRQEGQAAVFGRQWTAGTVAELSGNKWAYLHTASATSVAVVDGDGEDIGFTAAAGAGWKPGSGAADLTPTGSVTGSFTLEGNEGTTSVFTKVDTTSTTWQLSKSFLPTDHSTTSVYSEKVRVDGQVLARPKLASQPSEGRGARRCARSFSSSSSTNVSIG